MKDDAVSGERGREALHLLRAYLGIADPGKRQTILHLAERLADAVTPDAKASVLASARASLPETEQD